VAKIDNSSALTVPDSSQILGDWGNILEGHLIMNLTGIIYVFRFELDIL
jgi:hypothetical protein